MMGKRSGKFYRKNEAEVMERLGLRPTKGSGSGWIEKEDGQSDDVLCQLKSTDAGSIKVNKQDIDTLEYNAMVAHKLPVFAIQFLQSDQVYLLVSPNVLQEIAQYLQSGEVPDTVKYGLAGIDVSEREDCTATPTRVIKSSSSAREAFTEEQEQKYRKKWRSAT